MDASFPLSYTEIGPSNISGSTNYALSIHSNVTDNPIFNLWILDSGKDNCEGQKGNLFLQSRQISFKNISVHEFPLFLLGWGCIKNDQIKWYESRSSLFANTYGYIIPSIAFFHIPLPEVISKFFEISILNLLKYLDLWNNEVTEGSMQENSICCSSYNTGFFESAVKMKDIIGMYCGHDHMNDFQGKNG